MPREDRGRFDLAECSKQYIAFLGRPEVSERRAAALGVAGSKKITSARADLVRAQAERAQLRLAKERGELIPLQVYEDEVGTAFRTVRDRLLRLPSQIASQLEMQPLAVVQTTLDKAIRAALAALSKGEG